MNGEPAIEPEDAAAGPAWLLGEPLVTVDEIVYRGRDVVAAGALSGAWRRLEHELELGLAAVDRERPPRAQVTEAMRGFRYARKLISAQDFLDWATRRRLAPTDVRACLERGVARRRTATLDAPEPVPARDALLAALVAEAICTGTLRACAVWLVDRVLVARDSGPEPASMGGGSDLLCYEDDLLAAGVLDEPVADRQSRLTQLAAAASAYDLHAGALCTPEAIARCVGRNAIDWTSFVLAGVRCPTEGAAAEALLLLREDSVAPQEVARLIGVDLAHLATRLEDAPEALRGRLVGASPGDVVGPVATDGAHWVWTVCSRVAATPADAELAARARAIVLGDDIERRAAGRVRWHERD